MYTLFKKCFMVWISIFSFQSSLMALDGYFARPVDCNNSSELEEVVNFYLKHRPYSPHLKNKERRAGKNHRSLTSYHAYLQSIKDRVSERSNHVTFVCISQKTNKISGLLFGQYGYRREYLAEFNDIITENDAFEDSMHAFIQGAEKYLVQKSITKIAVSVWSQKEFALYIQNGFCVMDSDAQTKDYFINMDAVFTLFSLVTIIPALYKKLFHYGIVCKDIA